MVNNIKKTYGYPMGILQSLGAIHPHQRNHHYHLYQLVLLSKRAPSIQNGLSCRSPVSPVIQACIKDLRS